jgi:hypothetical protein
MAVHYEVRPGETLAIRGPASVTVKGGEVPLIGDVGANVEPPVLASIDPETAAIVDPEFTLTATGADFEAGSRIVLGLTDAPTTFVDANTLTTTINPALFAPGDVAVTVRTGPSVSAASNLTFTDAASGGTAKKRRH